MPEINYIAMTAGLLRPATDIDAERAKRFKVGAIVTGTFRANRNVQLHRKLFSLFHFAYDNFEPEAIDYKGQEIIPEKNFEAFREWLVIRAGYYDVIGLPSGAVRLKAKSLAYHAMDEAEFEELYSKIAEIVRDDVLQGYEGVDLQRVIQEAAGYL